ncbi:MAG: polynucleotide adenylyltransferase PcnB, partial [Gammaproteobacteria bacterium]|nr:polynucleotide adenylyltransferase PcnB [Gammaproteobacteria bacterium]
AANNVISKQQLFTSIPKRFSGPMRDIWFLQSRLPSRFGQKPDRTMEHKRFRAAYDFLLLREQAGEKTEQLGEWWTEYQEATEERKLAMKQATSNGRPRKRKRKPRRKPSNSDHASSH